LTGLNLEIVTGGLPTSDKRYTTDSPLIVEDQRSNAYASGVAPKEKLVDIIKVPTELPAGSDESLKALWKEKLPRLLQSLNYENTEKQNSRVFAYRSFEDKKYLVLPSNARMMSDDPVFGIILLMLSYLGVPFMVGDSEMNVPASVETARLFWAGFSNRLTRPIGDRSTLNFSISKDSPQESGRACADAEAFLKYSGMPSALFYLPDSVKFGMGKGKLLSQYVSQLGGARGLSGLGDLPSRLNEVISLLLERQADCWKQCCLTYKIPLSVITKNIIKMKKITVVENNKKVDKLRPIHLVKPTAMLEALLESDKALLKTLNGPWDNLVALTEKYAAGVPPVELDNFSEKYKKYYEEQFNNAQKLTSWRAMRRRSIERALSQIYGKKVPKYSARLRNEVLHQVASLVFEKEFDSADEAEFDAFTDSLLRDALGLPRLNWSAVARLRSLRSNMTHLETLTRRLTREELDELCTYYEQFENFELTIKIEQLHGVVMRSRGTESNEYSDS